MRRVLRVTAVSSALIAAACSSAVVGKQVEARLQVQITDEPLGDVVLGELRAGDRAAADCFVEQARSNAGLTGSAVRITSGRTTGYTAVTTFPPDPTARRLIYDIGEEALRRTLPPCPTSPHS